MALWLSGLASHSKSNTASDSLVFGDGDMLYVGVEQHGVMSYHAMLSLAASTDRAS